MQQNQIFGNNVGAKAKINHKNQNPYNIKYDKQNNDSHIRNDSIEKEHSLGNILGKLKKRDKIGAIVNKF
jgi:hypothetical protein